jgi:hypothetical protein
MIIVTGLPRSGTQWAAWVLNELGVNAQHEGVEWDDDYAPSVPEVEAVSSWALAVADLPDDAVVFSMRRTKGDWLDSMMNSRIAAAWKDGAPWVDFARHNLEIPEAHWSEMTPDERALALYDGWPAPGELLRPGTKKAVAALAKAADVSLTVDETARLAEHVVDPTG